MMHGFYGPWNMGFYGFPIFGLIFGIAILVLVVYLIILVARKLKNNGLFDNQLDNNPITIAKRRYARGEITKEEYEAVIKDLKAMP